MLAICCKAPCAHAHTHTPTHRHKPRESQGPGHRAPVPGNSEELGGRNGELGRWGTTGRRAGQEAGAEATEGAKARGGGRTIAPLCEPCLHFPFLLPRSALRPVLLQHRRVEDRAGMEAVRVKTVGAPQTPDSPWERAQALSLLAAQWAQLTLEFPALFLSSMHLLCRSQPVRMYHHIRFIREGTKDQNVGDRGKTLFLCPQRLKSFLCQLSQVPSVPESLTAGHSTGTQEAYIGLTSGRDPEKGHLCEPSRQKVTNAGLVLHGIFYVLGCYQALEPSCIPQDLDSRRSFAVTCL